MTTIQDIIHSLVGTPPAGYEALDYVVAAIIAFMIIDLVFDLFRWLGKAV